MNCLQESTQLLKTEKKLDEQDYITQLIVEMLFLIFLNGKIIHAWNNSLEWLTGQKYIHLKRLSLLHSFNVRITNLTAKKTSLSATQSISHCILCITMVWIKHPLWLMLSFWWTGRGKGDVGWGISQSVKYLLCKHERPSSILRTHTEKARSDGVHF